MKKIWSRRRSRRPRNSFFDSSRTTFPWTISKRGSRIPTFSVSSSRLNSPPGISSDTARPCLSSICTSCSRHLDSSRWTYTPWSAMIKNYFSFLSVPFETYQASNVINYINNYITWYIKVSLKNISSTMHEYSEYATFAFNRSWRIFVVPGTMLWLDSMVGSTVFFNKASFIDKSLYTLFHCTSVCLSSHAISSSGFSTNISHIEHSIEVWSKNHWNFKEGINYILFIYI